MDYVNNSTGAFYARSKQDISALRGRAETLQQQIGTSNRLARSSDDPVAASRLRTLARAERLAQIDQANANRATADLTLADEALSSFAGYLTRARELVISAGNDTLTQEQRAAVGVELEQIHGNLFSLANARDVAGHALFGGEATGAAYTLDAAGNAVYAGTGSSGELPLGEGQSVTRGLTGPQFLTFDLNGTPTDIMAVVRDLGIALQATSGDPAQTARDALGAMTGGIDAVTTGQTLVGTRLSWIELTTDRRISMSELHNTEKADIGGTDIASTVAELQELMVVLEASQASFGRLSGLSLFNQLR